MIYSKSYPQDYCKNAQNGIYKGQKEKLKRKEAIYIYNNTSIIYVYGNNVILY